MAGDVFDHHDGIVDHKARRHGQRHEREIVEQEPDRYITPSVPSSETITALPGSASRASFAGTG
jgi:hypothetical protein